jgi:hypothetical protein
MTGRLAQHQPARRISCVCWRGSHKCPNCNLINPDEGERCDCGYDFSSGSVQRSYATSSKVDQRQARREDAEKDMLHGALWCVGGIVVTVATYAAASGGGAYVVAWGAILFGAIQFLRGAARRH